jgi:S1-C subfamily serine protease
MDSPQVYPIALSVTYLEQIVNGEVTYTATGFFYKNDKKVFLVTNRHVVRDTDALRMFLHCDNKDLTKNYKIEIPLRSSSNELLWKEHPTINADIAVIDLSNIPFIKGTLIVPQSIINHFPHELLSLPPGDDVFAIGYPHGYFDEVHNLPIFKNAIIASCYGIDFQNHPYFLVDANLKPGMSGSPVFTKPVLLRFANDGSVKTCNGGLPYYLLGVLSKEELVIGTGERIAPGLFVVWYIRLVEDIIKLF